MFFPVQIFLCYPFTVYINFSMGDNSSLWSLNVSIHKTDVFKAVSVSLNTNMILVICKADTHISLMGCKTLTLSTNS